MAELLCIYKRCLTNASKVSMVLALNVRPLVEKLSALKVGCATALVVVLGAAGCVMMSAF